MKKLLSLLFASVLVVFSGSPLMAADGGGIASESYLPVYEREAGILHQHGFLAGSDRGFELDKPLTRLEGAVMVARLLGEEEAIQNGAYDNLEFPFTDVPAWGQGYVKYLYHNKITAGTGSTTYGSSDPMTAKQYTTLMLRILGYDDSKGDFVWTDALSFAQQIGLVSDAGLFDVPVFYRDLMVKISYETLNHQLKERSETLIESLAMEGVVDLPGFDYLIPLSGFRMTWVGQQEVLTEIERDGLPDHMKDFKYFNVTQKDHVEVVLAGTVSEEEFQFWKSFIVDYNLGWLGDYMTSVRVSNDVYLNLFLLDEERNIIGYRVIHASEVANGVKQTPTDETPKQSETEKPAPNDPDAEEDKIRKDDIEIVDVSDALVLFKDSFNKPHVILIRSKLPEHLQDISYIGLSATGKGPEIKTIEDVELGNGHIVGRSSFGTFSASNFYYNEGDRLLIPFYDEHDQIFAIHIVKQEDFNKDNEYLYDLKFSVEGNSGTRLTGVDISIVRKVNGKADPYFEWYGGSTGMSDGVFIVYYMLFENESVEYEVQAKDPNVTLKYLGKTPSRF